MKKLFVVSLLSTLWASSVLAASTNLVGTLSTTARGDASILTTKEGKEYYFSPTSAAGKKIWNVCELEKACTVIGAVVKGDKIISVSSAKLGSSNAPAAVAATNEKTVKILKIADASESADSVTTDSGDFLLRAYNKNYVSIKKKIKASIGKKLTLKLNADGEIETIK